MPRRVLVALLILTLLGFTGVKVSALWSQPEQPRIVAQPLLDDTLSEADWLLTLDAHQLAFWQRLEHRLQNNPDDYEASLLKSLLLFQGARLNAAVIELQQLTRWAPKFQLAHLVLGDLLLARFDQISSIGKSDLLICNCNFLLM